MAIAITWTQGTGSPVSLSINDAAEASLEQYRQSIVEQVSGPNGVVTQTIYPDILSLVLASITPSLIQPAFRAFPPTDVQQAQQDAVTAQQTAQTAMQTFIQSAISRTN